MSDQVTDGLELANTLATLHATSPIGEIKHDAHLQIVEREHNLPLLAHFDLDLMVPVQVQLHQDLLNKSLIWDTISKLNHFAVVFLAI